MGKKSRRMNMKYCSIAVVLAMLLNICAGVLPLGITAKADTVTELRMDVRSNVGIQPTYTLADGVSESGDGSGGPGWKSDTGAVNSQGEQKTLYNDKWNRWVQYTPSEAATLEAGEYDVYYWSLQNAPRPLIAEIKHNGKTDTSENLPSISDTSAAAHWEKIGTYDFAGTGDEYLRLTAAGGVTGNSRVADVKFVKAGTAVPSPEASPAVSASPSSDPGAPAAVLDEDFDDAALNQPFKETGWGFPAATNVVKEKSPGNNYLEISCTGDYSGFISPSMYTLNGNRRFVGTDIISSFKFNIHQLSNSTEMFLARTNSNQAIADIRPAYVANSTTEFKFTAREGSAMTAVSIDYTFQTDNWYQMITKLNSNTGTYDLYFLDDNGNCLTYVLGIHARYDTSLTSGVVDFSHWQTNNFKNGAKLSIDEFYIADDPDYKLPAVPSPSPAASPSPSGSPRPSFPPEGAIVFDDGEPAEFELVIPSDTIPGTYQKGVSTWGSFHTWTDLAAAQGVYSLNNVPAGEYEVYYRMPLVHENNADAVYLEVTDSLNKTGRVVFNPHTKKNESNVLDNVSETGIRSMDWIKLDGTYTFYSTLAGKLTAGVDIETATPTSEDKVPVVYGNVRFDSVALVKVSDVPSIPVAVNTRIEGKIKPGAVLSGKYEYVEDNGNAEKDSAYKWYTKPSENAAWTVAAQGTTTAEQGASYTVKSTDKFVKFEITPKSDAQESSVGVAQSAVYELLYDSDLPPVAKNIKITGAPAKLTDLTAAYEYEDVNLDEEGESQYKWIISSDPYAQPYSKWEVLEEGTCTAADPIIYHIPLSIPNGSYIRLMITPKNNESSANKGTAVYSEAIGPFTDDEIKPEAKNLQYKGQVVNADAIAGLAIGGKAEAGYTYTYRIGLPEDTASTEIKWYQSETQDNSGLWTEIAQGSSYTPTEADSGKYIRFGITPVSADGKSGETAFSQAYLVKWKLSFYDEFDYTAADGYDATFREKWVSASEQKQLGDPIVYQARIPENVSVSNGTFKITTRKEHLDKYKFDHDWTTGSVWTKENFGPYGYYESSMKYTKAHGLNQSFWWMTTKCEYPQFMEMDFCETHYPYEIKTNMRYRADATTYVSNSIGHYSYGESGDKTLADEYNTIGGYLKPQIPGVDWMDPANSDVYRVFFNDQQIRSSRSNPDYPADGVIYMSIALLPGSFAGQLIESEADNSVIEYDYVRYYEEIGVSKDGSNTHEMDTIALNSAIEEASSLVSNSVIGTQTGTYPASARTELQTALNTAKAVTDNNQKGAAANALNQAIDAFKASVIGNPAELENLISNAQNVVNVTSEGTGYGQCPKNYLEILKIQISRSQDLLKDCPTQARIDSQITGLKRAIDNVIFNKSKSGAISTNGVAVDLAEVTGQLNMTGQANQGTLVFTSPLSQQDISFDAYHVLLQIPSGTSAVSGDKEYGWSVTKSELDQVNIDGSFYFSGLQTDKLMKLTFRALNGKSVGRLNGNTVTVIDNIISTDSYDAANAGYTGSGSYTVKYVGSNSITIYTNDPSNLCLYSEKAEPTPTPDNPGGSNGGGGNTNPGGGTIVVPVPKPSPKTSFTDISGHWAEKDILALTEKGIVKGRTETEFEPEGTMTRAEFAALIRRALGLNVGLYAADMEDISENDWYAHEIQAVIDAGIMTGDGTGYFRPQDSITRQEMAKVALNAYLYRHHLDSVDTAELTFTDSELIAQWAKESVGKAVALGLISGMGDGTFSPETNMTRAQGATIVARVIK